MLTKLGYAECVNLSIFDGEKEQLKSEAKIIIPKKEAQPTRLDNEIREISNMPNKVIKSKPSGSILCKVTNAVSPSEIWLQDIVDSDNCFPFYKSDWLIDIKKI